MHTRVVKTVRGFILQATYRVSAPEQGRVPVVHLYGRLEDGRTFRVRDDRQRPHFYVRAADAERVSALGIDIGPADKRTFDSAPACRLQVGVPADVPPLRDRLHSIGVDTFEADVRFALRYLIERGIKGGCEIVGEAAPGTGISWLFDNPLLRPATVKIEPRVLSFDIEMDPHTERLLAISLYAPGIDEVLIVEGGTRAMPERAVPCEDEAAALDCVLRAHSDL